MTTRVFIRDQGEWRRGEGAELVDELIDVLMYSWMCDITLEEGGPTLWVVDNEMIGLCCVLYGHLIHAQTFIASCTAEESIAKGPVELGLVHSTCCGAVPRLLVVEYFVSCTARRRLGSCLLG